MINLLEIYVPFVIDGEFFYSITNNIDVSLLDRGSLVVLNFNKKVTIGVVKNITLENVIFKNEEIFMCIKDRVFQIKNIIKVIDFLKIKKDTLSFIEIVAGYNVAPVGIFIKMMLGAILKRAILKLKMQNFDDLFDHYTTNLNNDNIVLSYDQQEVFEEIINNFKYIPGEFKDTESINFDNNNCNKKLHTVHVLHGITGSGKTEVYIKIAQKVLQNSGQVLLLLPEILLTTQISERLKKHFPDLLIWHSEVSSLDKFKIWNRVSSTSKPAFVMGARSALFLPFNNLQCIIVDEEHDSSYKQEDPISYHGRDMAIVRAKCEKIPIILCSATPSIDTLYYVGEGKYFYYTLKSRYHNVFLPQVEIIDMKTAKIEKNDENISNSIEEVKSKIIKYHDKLKTPFEIPLFHQKTIKTISETLEKNQQVLLFINRKGYAPVLFCKGCQVKISCNNCNACLVYHKKANIVVCHYCGEKMKFRNYCPICKEEEVLMMHGIGVEKVAEESLNLFPEAKIVMMTSDTVQNYSEASKVLDEIISLKSNLIIGTQIIAKGLHFPMLQLVVIIDASPNLSFGDIRIMEKTYQVLHQVIGRAGREKNGAKIIVQTINPENSFFYHLASHKYKDFATIEIESRKAANAPPFSRLICITLSGSNQEKVSEFAEEMKKNFPAKQTDNIILFGPAEPPIFKLRNKFRYRFIISLNKKIRFHKLIKDWLIKNKKPYDISIKIDVDPYNFT